MSRLDAFLHPVQTEDTREVVISKRFVDKDGKPVPFKIRSITQEENNGIIKACTRRSKNRDGGAYETLCGWCWPAWWILIFPTRSCAEPMEPWTRLRCRGGCSWPANTTRFPAPFRISTASGRMPPAKQKTPKGHGRRHVAGVLPVRQPRRPARRGGAYEYAGARPGL